MRIELLNAGNEMSVIAGFHPHECRTTLIYLALDAEVALDINSRLLVVIAVRYLDLDLTAGTKIHACGHMLESVEFGLHTVGSFGRSEHLS